MRGRETERERLTDRQTDRLTDRQRHRTERLKNNLEKNDTIFLETKAERQEIGRARKTGRLRLKGERERLKKER